jgi:hypothetical protein
LTLPDDHPPAPSTFDRQQAHRAREAAEALFRPRAHAAPADTSTTQAAPVDAPATQISPFAPSPEQDAPRKPRILAAATTAAPTNAAGPSVSPNSTPRRQAACQKVRSIPTSAYGRVRALVNYGMTIADVADLYGVPVSEVERIVPPDARSPEASTDNRD